MLASGLSREEVRRVASTLASYVRPGDLFVASSDFTHYGHRFQYLGPPGAQFTASQAPANLKKLLQAAWSAIARRDVDAFFAHKAATGDTICGFLPIAVLLALLPEGSTGHLLKTDTSGNMTGDYDNSVSYLAAAFTGLWPYDAVDGAGSLTKEEKEGLLRLGRRTVDTYVRTGQRTKPEDVGVTVTERLRQNSGVFVTLKISGRLRGCIGTILPVKPLVRAVIDNGINAAAFDRRFKPVRPEELKQITVEVSVLTPPVAVAGPEEIILGRHGIIVEKGGHSAVYLPQVAPEQGWTLEETLGHLSKKAGLGSSGWRDGAHFKVFEAIVFHEPH